MKNLHRFAVLGMFVSFTAGASLLAQEEASRARVVRLSFGEGTVTVLRPDVSEWSTAPVNTPIQEGFKLSTAADSYAEVEFENGSAARLGESGILAFTQLGLASSGAKLNRMTLEQGYATFSLRSGSDDVNELSVGDATITVPPSSEARFRTDLENGALRVEVFKGSVSVTSPEGSQDLAEDMVLEIRPGAENAFALNKGITKDSWDKWVGERESVVTASMNHPAPGLSPGDVNSTMYGWNDLNNYGNWAYIPGYGYGWYPAAGADFIPYSNGRWVVYPGLGWTWVSFEPWGWLPYHYGQWLFYTGIGWVWIPDDFNSFFGADVVWFEGPGWFGWCPGGAVVPPATTVGRTGGRIIHGPKGTPRCPAGACGVVVGRGVVERGLPVNSKTIIGSNVFEGAPIRASSLPSNPPAMLPGSPVGGAAAAGRGRASVEGRNLSGASGIVYDPATGRFVNENNGTLPPAVEPEPRAPRGEPREEPIMGGRESGPSVWTRPAPATPVAPQGSARGGTGAERGSPGGGGSVPSSSSGGGHSILGGHSGGGGGGHGFSGGGSHSASGGGGFSGGSHSSGGGGGGGASSGGGHSGGGSSSSSSGGHH